ncbi:MAG: aspartokinase/homoserine dehydrogenase 1 [Polaribacter sp.]|jgi:aspartokinase/homoserine dehydrogenase 1
MKVLKFGGSSVAKPERIQAVIDILNSYYKNGEQFTVVFSALGGVTDSLINMSKLASKGDNSYLEEFESYCTRHRETAEHLLSGEYLKTALAELEKNENNLRNFLQGIFLLWEASPRAMDYVTSFGERNSAFLISIACQQNGINARFLDARKVIKTDAAFGVAKVNFKLTDELVSKYYQENPEIHIVTGFVSSTKGGLSTTLGRGGSDYTAAILAAALEADCIEIWTDVNGVLTADPRKVQKVFTIPEMSYAEAMEMSHFGAKVIYPPTLLPALHKNIPLYIKNTFNPTFEGTHISSKVKMDGQDVRGISSINDISLMTLQGSGLFGIPGIAARLFNSLALAKVNIILITQGSSESSITFAVTPKSAKKAKRIVEEAFQFELKEGSVEPIKLETELSVIAIIGENMRYHPGIAGRLFTALGKNGVNCVAIAQGSSELNVSIVINRADEEKGLNALHETFFLSKTKVLHLFIAGVGLIGSTLLKQISQQADYLLEKQSLELRIVGLSNSKKMLFDTNGINLDDWKADLMASEQTASIGGFVQEMKKLNLANSIFVDNTASEQVANQYESILDSSISISTPNKIATSSSYPQYLRLKKIAVKRGVQFLYETNVGAGLPVINTLHDLIHSGDQIIKIEGVLSGSMSFIFNCFDGSEEFSIVVEKAKELGYTEPDPRLDLMGVDIRRKIIILARESGIPLEAKDVVIEQILPDACIEAKDVETFFSILKENNNTFAELQSTAAKENKVLRMVATLDNGKANIRLRAVGADHPFYSLSGSDNMIVFTTKRYNERPLVIRGPGAGAEVTAAGVFAEVIKLGNNTRN